MRFKIGDVIRSTANTTYRRLRFTNSGAEILESTRISDISVIVKLFPGNYEHARHWVLDETYKVKEILERYDV
jgi:hypothetical protein